MIQAWVVVREEKHIDDRFWVCLKREDALTIAADVAAYWVKEYDRRENEIFRDLYEDQIFNCESDSFRVYVQPQTIREPGETEAT